MPSERSSPPQACRSVRTRATLHADKNRVPCGQAGNAFPGVYQAGQVAMRQHPNTQASPNRPRVNRKKRKKNAVICLPIQTNALSLHPQTRNDGGIAQLVRAHDS